MNIVLKDTFNNELPADPILSNYRRQVKEACFSFVIPRIPTNPTLVHVSNEVAQLLGVSKSETSSKKFLDIFSGKQIIQNSKPYAMCYGGHQFGNWAGQLGDGRAINLGEIMYKNIVSTLQLKGAGETPYSRTADGLAVLRSSIREHLCSEAMYHLGVPTTRSLSLVLTGDKVWRDVMYDGNPEFEKGAVVCRVAPSFIRFGNFQIFTSRGDLKSLKKLTDYTIKHHYPNIKTSGKNSYISFFEAITNQTLEMIIHWQRVGFVHGVMNTDNMSIHGLTIDYGPYGWLEGYDKSWTPNTTDSGQKRYRFGSQGNIALWNLLQLANALYPLIEDPKPLEKALHQFQSDYQVKYHSMMLSKIGITNQNSSDKHIIDQLEKVLALSETDMTIFFRNLSNFNKEEIIDNEGKYLKCIEDAFYNKSEIKDEILMAWNSWFKLYKTNLLKENNSNQERMTFMNKINPKYVLRNYMAQLAIEAADATDYSIVKELYELLLKPYEEQVSGQKWFAKRPEWARNKVGCSMLSCSS